MRLFNSQPAFMQLTLLPAGAAMTSLSDGRVLPHASSATSASGGHSRSRPRVIQPFRLREALPELMHTVSLPLSLLRALWMRIRSMRAGAR